MNIIKYNYGSLDLKEFIKSKTNKVINKYEPILVVGNEVIDKNGNRNIFKLKTFNYDEIFDSKNQYDIDYDYLASQIKKELHIMMTDSYDNLSQSDFIKVIDGESFKIINKNYIAEIKPLIIDYELYKKIIKL